MFLAYTAAYQLWN